jgi:hypothetical protein
MVRWMFRVLGTYYETCAEMVAISVLAAKRTLVVNFMMADLCLEASVMELELGCLVSRCSEGSQNNDGSETRCISTRPRLDQEVACSTMEKTVTVAKEKAVTCCQKKRATVK